MKNTDDISKNKSKLKKIMPLIIGIILVLFIVLYRPIIDYCNYCKAVEEMNKGEYEYAVSIFNELGEYKDSKEKVLECEYIKVCDYMKEKKYEEAIEILQNVLIDYEDANDKIKECIKQISKKYISDDNIKSAVDFLLRYNDKYHSEVVQGVYEIAQIYVEQGNFYEAVSVLETVNVSGNVEAENLLKKIFSEQNGYFYAKAEQEYSSANFEVANICYKYASKNGYSLPNENNMYNSEFMYMIQGEYYLEKWYDNIKKDTIVIIKGFEISEGENKYTIIPEYRAYDIYYKKVGVIKKTEDTIYFLGVDKIYDKLFDGQIDVWSSSEQGDRIETHLMSEERANEWIAYYENKENNKPAAKKEPAIGMSTEEVLKSTWGEPEDINKTTYAWGTTEQWCYSNYRYIYFENGKVVAISE